MGREGSRDSLTGSLPSLAFGFVALSGFLSRRETQNSLGKVSSADPFSRKVDEDVMGRPAVGTGNKAGGQACFCIAFSTFSVAVGKKNRGGRN